MGEKPKIHHWNFVGIFPIRVFDRTGIPIHPNWGCRDWESAGISFGSGFGVVNEGLTKELWGFSASWGDSRLSQGTQRIPNVESPPPNKTQP